MTNCFQYLHMKSSRKHPESPGSWTKQLCICRELLRLRMRTKNPTTARIVNASWPIPRSIFRPAGCSSEPRCRSLWFGREGWRRENQHQRASSAAWEGQLRKSAMRRDDVRKIKASRMPLTPKRWCVLEARGALQKLGLAMSSANCRIRRKTAGPSLWWAGKSLLEGQLRKAVHSWLRVSALQRDVLRTGSCELGPRQGPAQKHAAQC